MGSLSIWHWLIVLLIVALVFGTKKLRNIGGDLGGAVKGFKEGMKELYHLGDLFKTRYIDTNFLQRNYSAFEVLCRIWKLYLHVC